MTSDRKEWGTDSHQLSQLTNSDKPTSGVESPANKLYGGVIGFDRDKKISDSLDRQPASREELKIKRRYSAFYRR